MFRFSSSYCNVLFMCMQFRRAKHIQSDIYDGIIKFIGFDPIYYVIINLCIVSFHMVFSEFVCVSMDVSLIRINQIIFFSKTK